MPKATTSAVSKKTGKQVVVWFPQAVVAEIESLLPGLDTDRSKFIRRAVKEKLTRSR